MPTLPKCLCFFLNNFGFATEMSLPVKDNIYRQPFFWLSLWNLHFSA